MNTHNDVMMKEYSNTNINTNLNNSDPIPKIRVVVRKRPLNKREISKNEMDIIDIRNGNTVIVKELKTKVDLTKYVEEHNFTFDMAYDDSTTNETIYLDSVRPMIEAAFNKTKVTCFAYGQTGSGKTFTMMGPGTNALEMGTPGLYLLSAFDIFSYLEFECYNHLEIWVSFYEIYCGKLFDLLNDRALLTAREDGKQNICIVGLTEKQVTNLTSMMQLIEYGLKVRTVGVTGANSDSSRSHGIIQIAIKEPNGNPHGKISFIDLAGSERAADTIDTNKQTKIDGAEINKSLLALKECIRALDQDKKYTPFRGSKLTLVLRDSFMGNCKTLMIANISPCLICSEHTLNTLRYADRVKELRGRDNKDSKTNEMNVDNTTKDPQEVLANLLMMPRQHGKTVKYNVDKNNNPIRSSLSGNSNYNSNNTNLNPAKTSNNLNSINNNTTTQTNRKLTSNTTQNGNLNLNQNPNQVSSNQTSNTKSTNSFNNYNINTNKENTNNNLENHLFNLLNNKKTKSSNEITPNINTISNPNKFPTSVNNIQIQQNNNYNNINSYPNQNQQSNTQVNSNVNNFLANYNSFTNKQRNSIVSQGSRLSKSPSRTNEVSEEELQKLSERHERLINKILIEEESYIENHRKHIDSIVEIIKEEMNLVNDVEKPGSNIEFYVNAMEKVYNQQLEKINFMKTRLINFKNLLKEEEELSQKFLKLNEMMGSMLTDSFHCNSQSNYSKSEDLNNFDEGF